MVTFFPWFCAISNLSFHIPPLTPKLPQILTFSPSKESKGLVLGSGPWLETGELMLEDLLPSGFQGMGYIGEES